MFVLFLVACQIDQGAQGTAVGNPTGMTARIAPGDDLEWTSAHADVSHLDLVDCEDQVSSVPVGARLDLLGASAITVPSGTWCELGLAFGSYLELVADGPNGSTATLRLAVPSVHLDLDGDADPEGGDWLLELASPSWIDARSLEVDDGEQIVVLPGGDLAIELAAVIEEDSTLFVDLDSSGWVDETERDQGELGSAKKDKGNNRDKGRGRNNPEANPGRGKLDTGDNPGVGREDGSND